MSADRLVGQARRRASDPVGQVQVLALPYSLADHAQSSSPYTTKVSPASITQYGYGASSPNRSGTALDPEHSRHVGTAVNVAPDGAGGAPDTTGRVVRPPAARLDTLSDTLTFGSEH